MILASDTLPAQLKLATIFFDTNVFSTASRNREFFDFLLYLKALPLDVFNRVQILAVENQNEVKNFAIFEFDNKKYNKAAGKLLLN